MFKIEKNIPMVVKKTLPGSFRVELIETMKVLKIGESFIIPIKQRYIYFRESLLHPNEFQSNKISDTEVRIYRINNKS